VSSARSLKIKHTAISGQHSAKTAVFATLCRPNTWKEKTRLKFVTIERLKRIEKGLRPFGHRSVELGFDVCFQ
jgi:hypothetical protein